MQEIRPTDNAQREPASPVDRRSGNVMGSNRVLPVADMNTTATMKIIRESDLDMMMPALIAMPKSQIFRLQPRRRIPFREALRLKLSWMLPECDIWKPILESHCLDYLV